jgi:hypothetical protein
VSVPAKVSEQYRYWRANPIQWVRDRFQIEPDEWQKDALHGYATSNRLAMKACKGPGKTAVLAWIVLHFLDTRPHPKVAATSVTGDNLDTNLWPEIAKWLGKSPQLSELFKWTATKVVHRQWPATWFAVARTWPKSGSAEEQSNALAGIHADYVMFVLDESGGIPQSVMVTAEAVLASGIESKVVQAGNPTHTSGPLYRACTVDRALWYVVTITGDPDDPKRSPRISLTWAREQIASYGRDNPWVMVNVLGEFPPTSINALLGVEDVNRAMARHLRLDEFQHMQRRIGVDVARFGDDRTVLFPRQGLASFRPVTMRGAATNEIAARLMVANEKWHPEINLIDDTGHWGHGVIDNCRAAGMAVVGVQYHGKAIDKRYKNRRAEMWLKGAKAIEAGAALPNLPDMVAELTEPTYTFINGVFVLEEKDQIKARLGKSPDLADAYMLTYALPDMPGELVQALQGRQQTAHDFDPYVSAEDRERERTLHEFDPWTQPR